MRWVAPAEKNTAAETLERRLWEAADQLRANSGLTSAKYGPPVLRLISPLRRRTARRAPFGAREGPRPAGAARASTIP